MSGWINDGRMDPANLFRKRQRSFFMEIRPYLAYALQSLTLVFIILMMAVYYFYTRVLPEIPPQFPLREVAALIAFPFLARSPVRTYLKKADLVYVVPLEGQMTKAYFPQAINRAFAAQGLGLLLIWLAVWPAFALAEGSRKPAFLLVLLLLIVGKRLFLQGRWNELKHTEPSRVRTYRLLRWIAAGALAYTLLALPVWQAVLGAAITLLAYLGLIRLVNKRHLYWPGLIAEEQRLRSAVLRKLNLFIDVAEIHGQPRSVHAPRGLLRALGGFGFESKDTYRFLYTLVWLRSEWFGVSLRLTAVGVLAVACASGLYAPGIVFLVFSGLLSLQLKELDKAYRHSDWSFIYPLAQDLRPRSSRSVRRRIQFAALVLLALPLFWATDSWAYAAAFWAGGVLVSLLPGMRKQAAANKR